MHNSNIKRQGGLQLIRGLHNLRQQQQRCVLTIGKFDGVHLGHQAVLVNLVEKAKTLGLASTVMIFEPQPEEVFAPQHAPA
jgi:riboflavin kinase/FMN adenylyltransferase